MRYEWRRDFSNQPSFLTNIQGVLSKEQNTATLGLLGGGDAKKGHGERRWKLGNTGEQRESFRAWTDRVERLGCV